MTNGLFGPLLFKNTGKICKLVDYKKIKIFIGVESKKKKSSFSVEAYANPFVINGGQVHGGVLCGEKFTLYKIRHWISKDPDGHSYNQINGKG